MCNRFYLPWLTPTKPRFNPVTRKLKNTTKKDLILGQVIETYNTSDYHSGIANFIPAQVHDGSWEGTAYARQATVSRYYAQHPKRFNRPPRIKLPPKRVSINAGRPDDDYLLVS